MYSTKRFVRPPAGSRSGGKPPRDLLVLIGILLLTYSLQFFQTTRGLVERLALTPEVWESGELWRLATYAFLGEGSFWFVLTLIIVFWFGRDVLQVLGRRHFWRLIAQVTLTASIVAVLIDIPLAFTGLRPSPPSSPFILMQGSEMLLTILVSAFATLYRNSTIYLMFILPVQARWFLWLAILFAFLGFLPTKDFAGFVGICVAVGATYSILTAGSLRRALREYRLRLERLYLEAKMKRSRRRFRVVKDDDDVFRGPWVN